MEERLLHVFRNTPLGRETLLQSLYFCKTLGASLQVYVPESTQFLMYFEFDAAQVDLDASYLTSPATAVPRVKELAEQKGVKPFFFKPKNFTASQLPDIPVNYSYMCCPRTVSDSTAKIGMGYIGPKVRRIVKGANFPVLMTSSAFKEWKSITVFYGGSDNANKALRWGLHLSRKSGYPLDILTFTEGRADGYFDKQLQTAGLDEDVRQNVRTWHKISEGRFEESLYTVAHDAILVLGAYGHGLIKDVLFGSRMEAIQSWMPNNILLVGPNCMFSGGR